MKKPDIYLYNSLSKQKEQFVPLVANEVSMYVCGPTVYDYVHVGNTRPVVVFDTLRRLFEYVNYKVTYVSNYTDVDDKIIERAAENNTTEHELSEFYIAAFEDTLAALNAKKPTFTPRATKHINGMLKFVETLIKRGFAYEKDGEVFFRVQKVDDYGTIANIQLDDLQAGARISENEKKEYVHDFLLWKKTDTGLKWDSPWGAGRPGWHTECVVMINDIFNKPLIDIHGGGFDLKFPHHTNEIAQSEAYAGTTLANVWMHNGFINLNNEKMAKSTGNFISAKDFISEHGGSALRLLLLSSHYRSPVNLSEDIITNSKNELLKMKRTLLSLKRYLAVNEFNSKNETLLAAFIAALADDLNTPNALSEVYALIKEANILLRNPKNNGKEISEIYHALSIMLSVLGLDLGVKDFSEEDIELLKDYENARINKDFAQSDALRAILIERGIFEWLKKNRERKLPTVVITF